MKRVRISRILLVAALAALFHMLGSISPLAGLRDNLFSVFFGLVRTEKQNEKEAATAQEYMVRIGELEKENQELRQEKGVAPQSGSSKVLARIVWFEPNPITPYARIDQGEVNGISQGAIVVAPGGIFLGKVQRVFPRSATITFLTDPSFRFSVVMGEKRVVGLAQAANDGMLMVEFVPRESLPEQGDQVFTAGKDDGVPRDLFVGTVIQALSDPKEPFGRITVKPQASSHTAEFVFVYLITP